MKRKVFSVLFALVLVFSFSLISAVPVVAQPAEVWVDDDFAYTMLGWGATHFNTIQAGIDAVALDGTVNVAEGTYAERLTIGKTLTLTGTGLPTLDVSDFVGYWGVDVTAPGVVIEGFRFIGVPPASLDDSSSATNPTIRASTGADGLTVQNNVFDPSPTPWDATIAMGKQALLITDGVDNVSFLNNTVTDYVYGLTGRGWTDGTDNILVLGNAFNQSEWLETPPGAFTRFTSVGVQLWVGDGLRVIDNTFTGPGTMEGLFVEGDLVNVFAVADFNAFFALFGAPGATGAETIEIRDNTISSYYLGLGVFSGGLIEDNEISDTLIGIQIGQEDPVFATAGITAPLDITGNDILNNKRGIWVRITNDKPVVINFNDIVGNTEDGIALYGGATNVEVSENEVSGSGRHGIHLYHASQNQVLENQVEDSGEHGIRLAVADDNKVIDNQVEASGIDGIAICWGADGNQVLENEVEDSGRHGISVWSSSHNEIKENEVEESTGYDLFWDGYGVYNVWEENEYVTKTANIPEIVDDDDVDDDD